MINKTVRVEAAQVVQLQAEILISRPLFWQLAPLKHEIPPNLRFEIFYRHNKVLSPGGRERRSGVYLSLKFLQRRFAAAAAAAGTRWW